jgi:outer membrane autotransporter protein
MFMWGLQQVDAPNDPETDWVATWSPDAHDQPAVTGTLQTAWYDTVGHVEDQVYGNTYPSTTSNGGADLSPPVAGGGGGGKSALWGRITGNWSARNTTIDQDTPPLVFDTSLNQNTYSITAGAEFRPDDGADGVRLGLYGGYLSSSTTFDSYGGSSSAQGGMVGGYAALIKGPWYVDAEVKADFLSNEYSSAYVTLNAQGTNIGVLANTGYRFENGSTFFEPILSFAYLNTSLGDASGGGGTVTYSNGQSIRAGAGARVGMTTGKPGGTQTEFDLLGKVWNEFGGPNTVTVSDGNPLHDTTYTDSISGLFGEVTARATMYNADRSASGFVSVGGKFGANSTSISAKAGLRKAF